MDNSSSVWVIVPAYNEAAKIGEVLAELSACPFHVVVVDDGSDDGTRQAALHFPVTVLRHAANLGQGAALQTGIQYALRFPQARYLVTFDADGQHCASDIQPLVDFCRSEGYDIVLGSRFLEKGRAPHLDRRRWIILKLAILFTRVMTGLRLTDTHNGLRVLTVQAAARLDLRQNGMAHASELLAQVAALKLRYAEAPVTVRYTDYSKHKGQSLINGINILWELLEGFLR